MCAIILNLFLRIGVSKSAEIELKPGVDSSDKIFTFMEHQGSLWGAFRDVVDRAASVINEFLESVTQAGLSKESLKIHVTFDEFNLDVYISYKGLPIMFPQKQPSEPDLLQDETPVAALSNFLMVKNSDSVKSSVKGEHCSVHFHFNH